MPTLSFVIPHWPIDDEVNTALKQCVASLPRDSEKIVVVNAGTGFARNVNLGIGLSTGEFVGVVGNDTRIIEGDVRELAVPGVVTSPRVVGKPGIERGGFHGAFWVAPREVIELVGMLDEQFEGAFFEDDDYLERLRRAGVPTREVPTVTAESRRVGLTMSKVPEAAARWYALNERRLEAKWGWVPPPTDREAIP